MQHLDLESLFGEYQTSEEPQRSVLLQQMLNRFKNIQNADLTRKIAEIKADRESSLYACARMGTGIDVLNSRLIELKALEQVGQILFAIETNRNEFSIFWEKSKGWQPEQKFKRSS